MRCEGQRLLLDDKSCHLLVQTPQGNLSRYMRHLNGVYTQRYNRAHGCDGQLFRGRYKAILVEELRKNIDEIKQQIIGQKSQTET